ncbi:MAG TPA: CHRD domain-containing protein [Caulobacteraceae bacterium]|nr:CHRD domain-containing protein [Caulobacteraceae bacterium]
MESHGANHGRGGAPFALAALMAAGLLSGAAPAPLGFETRLSAVADDLSTRDDLAGVGHARASLQGNQLTVSGEYQGLASNATGAELRQGYGVGAPSSTVVGPLQVSGGRQGTLSGALKLTKTQLTAMKAGWIYVQIKSEKAPDGHLWGWLLPPRAASQ